MEIEDIPAMITMHKEEIEGAAFRLDKAEESILLLEREVNLLKEKIRSIEEIFKNLLQGGE